MSAVRAAKECIFIPRLFNVYPPIAVSPKCMKLLLQIFIKTGVVNQHYQTFAIKMKILSPEVGFNASHRGQNAREVGAINECCIGLLDDQGAPV